MDLHELYTYKSRHSIKERDFLFSTDPSLMIDLSVTIRKSHNVGIFVPKDSNTKMEDISLLGIQKYHIIGFLFLRSLLRFFASL